MMYGAEELLKVKNVVSLCGEVVSYYDDRDIYDICVVRESGIKDYIPVKVSNQIVLQVGQTIAIKGNLISYNTSNNGKLKLNLFVDATEIQIVDAEYKNYNVCIMDVTLCRVPTLRTTPSGKQIIELLMACNYAKGKSTYVPCIAWDKLARKINNNFKLGDTISVEGRFQSRSYTNREGESKITHELSIDKVNTPMNK